MLTRIHIALLTLALALPAFDGLAADAPAAPAAKKPACDAKTLPRAKVPPERCKTVRSRQPKRAQQVASAKQPAAESTWQHPTDAVALHALEQEILRNVGKQTQPSDYPETARRWNWSGTSWIAVVMGSNGKIKDTSLERTSGFRVLDEQALVMVRRVPSTRVPDRLKGREVTVSVPIGFYLAQQ